MLMRRLHARDEVITPSGRPAVVLGRTESDHERLEVRYTDCGPRWQTVTLQEHLLRPAPTLAERTVASIPTFTARHLAGLWRK